MSCECGTPSPGLHDVACPEYVDYVDECEGCGGNATKYDVEGVPLCDQCYADVVAECREMSK